MSRASPPPAVSASAPGAGTGEPPRAPRLPTQRLLTIGGLALGGGLLTAAWVAIDPAVTQIGRIEESRLPRMELVQQAKYADLRASVALRNLMLLQDARLDALELQRFRDAAAAAALALQTLGRQEAPAGEGELLRAVLRERVALEATRAAVVSREQQGRLASAEVDALTGRLQASLDRYEAVLQALYEQQGADVNALVDAVSVRARLARLLLVAAGAATLLTVLALAASWRAETRRQLAERDRQIGALRAQKKALVREVHHRIKNHLQGLLGLFEARGAVAGPADAEGALLTLRGHVLALVGIHGLQSRAADAPIALKDLLRQQVELVRSGWPAARIALHEDEQLETATLSPEQAVPVALVVTELMVNAVKHGAAAPVHVRIGTRGGRPRVSVANRLAAPTRLDWAAQAGLGTGLGLVATLVDGLATLEQRVTAEELTMTLELKT